jgi:hypothetical protein
MQDFAWLVGGPHHRRHSLERLGVLRPTGDLPPTIWERQLNILKLLALALTALVVIPSGAHLFELPAKIGLDQEAYFTVQRIYAGWAWFAIPIFGAICANGVLFLVQRRHDAASAWSALVSAVLILLSLVVFFTWVFPGNQATANWTEVPGNWQTLRTQWEYGHAANACINFVALLATGRALMSSRQEG